MREGAGQATKGTQYYTRPAGGTESMAEMPFSLLQVNELSKWFPNYYFKVEKLKNNVALNCFYWNILLPARKTLEISIFPFPKKLKWFFFLKMHGLTWTMRVQLKGVFPPRCRRQTVVCRCTNIQNLIHRTVKGYESELTCSPRPQRHTFYIRLVQIWRLIL